MGWHGTCDAWKPHLCRHDSRRVCEPNEEHIEHWAYWMCWSHAWIIFRSWLICALCLMIIWDACLIIWYKCTVTLFTHDSYMCQRVELKVPQLLPFDKSRFEHERLTFMWFCTLAHMRTLFALPSAHNVATKTSKNRNVTSTGLMRFHMLPVWNRTWNSQQHVRAHESEAYCVTKRVFFCDWCPPKKLKYGKPRLCESTSTLIVLDTPNLVRLTFLYF